MADISVDADVRAVQKDLFKVHQKLVPKAASQALNRTNAGVRTDLVKAIAAQFNVAQKRVRRRIFIPKDSEFRASPQRLHAGGRTLFAYLPEIYTLGKGVKAQRGAQGPNKFLMRTPNGHLGLYKRKGRDRLPVSEYLLDISGPVAKAADDIIDGKGAARWLKEFDAALKNQLRRVK